MAAALLAYAIGGFLVLPAVCKSQLEAKLPLLLHRDVTIEKIAFNPFTLTLVVTGFRATEPTGAEFASFKEFLANLQASSVYEGSVNLREVSLTQPSLAIDILEDGRTNFSNLLDTLKADVEPAPEDVPSKPLLVRIAKLTLHGGRLAFEDHSRNEPYATTVGPIDFEVTNFKTDPDWSHPHRFTARMDPNTALSWSGHFSVSPLWSDGHIQLTGVQLKSFAPYYPSRFRGRVLDGKAGLRLDYRLDTAGGRVALWIQHGALEVTDFILAGPDSEDPLVTLPELAVHDIAANFEKTTASIGSLSLSDAVVSAVRDKRGHLNFESLIAPPPSEAPTPQPEAIAAPQQDARQPPWHLTLHELQLKNMSLSLVDQVPERPARFLLDDLSVTLKDASYPETHPITTDISFRWNQQGTLRLSGLVHHSPFAADLDAQIKDFVLTPFQPYLSERLHVEMSSGGVDLRGHLTYGQPGPLTGKSGPMARYRGEVAVNALSAEDSRTSELLAKWDALRLTGIDAQVAPTRIAVDQIHLKHFLGRASISEDGRMNLTSLARSEPEQDAADSAGTSTDRSTEAASLSVKNVVIENAGLSLTDRSVRPPLATGMTQLTGRIQNVTYPGLSKMTFDMSAKVDKRAPFRITGQAQPRGKDSLLDMILALKGYDVPAWTGYSAKYVGYPIEKGTLSLDLKYGIADRKLTGDYMVLVDQLTLGNKTDSPEATSLPVKLALAILTDRQGQIHLNVPVGGSLDDPEFTLGRVILRAFLNILEKVATSPFALLGAVVGGGGEELQDIVFEAGRADLSETEATKLAKLAHALTERPALRLEVSAAIDPVEDRAALAKIKLRRLLKQKKLAAMGPAAQPEMTPDQVSLDEVEYETMVRNLHAALLTVEQGASPKEEVALEDLPPPPPAPSGFWAFLKKLNPFGSAEEETVKPRAEWRPHGEAPDPGAPSQAPFAEIEQAILAKQTVTDEDLGALRRNRMEAVMHYLIDQGQLGPDRVFASSTSASTPEAPPSTHATLQLN